VLRHALWFGVGVTLSLARGPGCGEADDAEGSVNAPCTRDKDCRRELACARGVCAERDAGGTGGGQEAGVDADAPRDAADGG
jgi:hypothetical protein